MKEVKQPYLDPLVPMGRFPLHSLLDEKGGEDESLVHLLKMCFHIVRQPL